MAAALATADLISDEEVTAIISFEEAARHDAESTSTSGAERKMPLVAEALGYLGGAFVAVGGSCLWVVTGPTSLPVGVSVFLLPLPLPELRVAHCLTSKSMTPCVA